MSDRPVLIAAGGTGGHVFPALAVANALQRANVPVRWVGTVRGIESRVVVEANIALQTIPVSALRGKGLMSRLRGVVNLLRALASSVGILRAMRPRGVLGMGGYVAGPVCLAARLSGYKMLLHEQNAIAGFTNRILCRFANRVFEAMPNTFVTSARVVHTGNPVRTEILAIAEPVVRLAGRTGMLRVLVLGGSQGAVALNKIVPNALNGVAGTMEVWHQCGANWLEDTQQAYSDSVHKVQVAQFIDDIAVAYGWADVVICRSGAMTVAELAAAGVASILVPFPHAVDDHQTANAQFLAGAEAAVLLPESQLTSSALGQLITQLSSDRRLLNNMAMQARSMACRDATDRIVNEILVQTA